MPKIDISGWGEFRIGDLFTQERGKESSPNRVEDGTLPMVNEINTNNGIAKFGKSSNVILGNCITVSVNYATNVFYQKNDFCASVNILVIRNTNMNEYSGKFIAGILSRNNLKYDYTNKISKDRLNDEFIKLPVDSKGNPDWLYMEEYMKNIEVSVCDKISKLESAKDVENSKIDVSSWGNFLISDVFETNKKGKSIQVPTGANIQKKDLKDGAIPRITVTGVNNGVFGYFEDIPNNDNYRIYENFISVSFLGTVFYQERKASLDMKVHCLKPLCHTLNKYTGEFLVSAILASLKESSYSDQISSTVLPMLSIKLPTDTQGKPDWQYMEEYMKNIESKVKRKIDMLIQI
jgi:hypothetical protein